MEKYRVIVELDVWTSDLSEAQKEMSKRLTEAGTTVALLPTEALKGLGAEQTGMMLGGPPTVNERGWKCLISLSKPEE